MNRTPLPLIVGFGGINGAGRASGHHTVARMAFDAMPEATRQRTLDSLAQVMGLPTAEGQEQYILDHTLIRRIEHRYFDPDVVTWNRRLPAGGDERGVEFEVERRNLPEAIPPDWEVTPTSDTQVSVKIRGQQELLLLAHRDFEVKAAGQLPTGFEPGELYPSRNHPRGLEMTVYSASDALASLGVSWDEVTRRVPVDKISVYAGSAMGQLDGPGTGGMLKARLDGRRVSSKYCPLGLAEMPADFINAYVLGSMGSTGASMGACASFLYNLRHGIDDLRSGRSRVAIIGAAEAPITPEVMEGYAAMGALASDKGLRRIDELSDAVAPDHRRACRPFAENCGFTIAESAQMLIMFDDALAMELGATIYGAATDVFVNADGFKKSIAGPGVGNYITMAKATASARALVGETRLRTGGLVQAHGTGTPQNRTTESEILSRVAKTFDIDNWPVAALKCYLGHSLGAASGDQINATLGMWAHGVIPGIATIDELAEDVRSDNLAFSSAHREIDPDEQFYAIINSKGFGGNNASATLLSPNAVGRMLLARYSKDEWQAWQSANETVSERQRLRDDAVISGQEEPIYHFDHGVLLDGDVELDPNHLVLGGHQVDLDLTSPYQDMPLN